MMRDRLRAIFWPWGQVRELRREVESMRIERDRWQHQALLMSDRYDKIRTTATQLRETLRLYRNA